MRIASLISAGTEMLYTLGQGHQLVAISHECDWPPECQRLPRVTRSHVNSTADSETIDKQVYSLLQDGKPLYEIDSELLADLQPDLIVTQTQCDVCAVRYSDVLQTVKNNPRLSNTQVFSLNPRSLTEVLSDIVRLGETLGIDDHAKQAVASLTERVDRIYTETSAISPEARPKVAMIEWTEPLMLAGNWVPELVKLAGGNCELTPKGEHSRYHTWEEFLRYDPQVIVVCPCGFDQQRAKVELDMLSLHPGWHNLTAVKTDQVFALDGNAYFNRPGPRLVESLELLAKLLRNLTPSTWQ